MTQVTRLLLSAVAFLYLLPMVTRAQVQTGTPPFGSFAGGPDVINLGNLNAHLDVPIVTRKGRGTDFFYDLTYDSSVWQLITSGSTKYWVPANNNWGWASNSTLNGPTTGFLTYYYSFSYCYDNNGHPTGSETVYGNTVYHDPWGISHSFPGIIEQYTGGCGNVNINTYPSQATDGSGLITNNYYGSVSTIGGAVYTPSVNPSGGSYVTSLSDRNGNYLNTNTSGQFFDTLSSQTPVLAVSGTNPVSFQYGAPSGSATYKLHYSSYSVQTNFRCPTVTEYGPIAVNLVSEIDMPDGSKYTFTYESTPGLTGKTTGRIASITLPTGGTINYSYSGGSGGITCADGSAATLTRVVNPGGTWTYARSNVSGTQWQTVVTTPNNDNTVLQFQQSGNNYYETQRATYQGSSGSGTLLQNILTCYNGNTANCNSVAVTIPISQRNITSQIGSSGPKSLTLVKYNSNGLTTEEDDYDFPSGTNLLKQTLISYASLGNGIVGLPSVVTVKDGAGTIDAQTTYTYDQGTVAASSGTPQHGSVTGSRGNATTISSYVSSSSSLTKTMTYYDTGTLKTSTDVNGAITAYNYPDATSTCGNAFPTSISEPLSLSRSFTWNCTGAVSTKVVDENSQPTTTSYTDASYWRPASVTDPTGAITSYSYATSAPFNWTESSLPVVSGSSVVDLRTTIDGLGRTILTQKKQGPAASNYDTVEADYDNLGRVAKVSLPFSATAGTTNNLAAGTTLQYDALGRLSTSTDSGGGTLNYSYQQNDITLNLGPVAAGEKNTKQKQLELNALGQLTSVCEIASLAGSGACGQVTAATGYWTKYAVNALGNIIGVTQNAQNTSATQTRSFSYDGLGRLTSEMNPESGTTTYTYDSSTVSGCQISSSGDLMLRINAAGFYSCYNYDSLHRLLSVGHNDGISPYKFFIYDSATVNGVAATNAKGRLAEAYTCITTCSPKATDEGFSYTARGETSDVYEWTSNSAGFYHSNASYWPNGVVNMLTAYNNANALVYGAGWNLDGEGRVNSNYNTQSNPLSGTTYNTASQPTQLTFSSGDSDSYAYDPQTNRMTQYKFNIPNQSVAGNLTWNANATLQSLSIQDTLDTANTQTCSYVHDDLVRIANVNCPGNQLQNPGFEQGLTSWAVNSGATLVTNASTSHSGSNYIQLSSSTNAQPIVQGSTISIKPGDKITYGGWVNLQSGSGGVLGWTLAVFDINNNAIAYQNISTPTSSGWIYQTSTYTVPSNGASAFLYAQIYQPTGSAVLLVDDAFIEDTPIWSQQFTYDAFGNISKSGSMLFQAMYAASTNHMTSIGGSTPTYDSNGNVTNDFLHTYTWDADGHPLKADGVSLTFDALGRMVEQSRSGTHTQFLYSPTGFKMMEFNGQSNLVARVPLPAGSRADYDPSGLHIRHGDWLGSYRFTSTLASRTMYSDGAYGPFGEPYAQAGTSDLSFTGMDQDTATNLYDFPARQYGVQGRWPSPDPAGLNAVDSTNPQSWNRYTYVLNNPCSLVDPLGLDSCSFNISLNNAANLTSLEGIKGVIETIFQQSSLGQPNSVGVNFVTNGTQDFTLTYDNKGVPGGPTGGLTPGNSNAGSMHANMFPYSDYGYATNILLGTVGAHEIGHGSPLGVPDLPNTGPNQNTLMSIDNNPTWTQSIYNGSFPSGLLFTPTQVATMFKKCQKKHGSSGGGGGGGNGGLNVGGGGILYFYWMDLLMLGSDGGGGESVTSSGPFPPSEE